MPDEKIEEVVIDETKPVDKKPVDDKPADGKPAEKPAEEKPTPPTKYELKLPEGSLLTKDDLDRVAGQALKQGLSQEQAAELLSNEDATIKRGADSYAKKQMRELDAETKRWIEVGMADPEIGGDKYAESAELSRRVIEKFGTEELRKALDTSKFGNYHELVRMMSRIGRAMDSDKLVIGDANNKQPKSLAERLYGGSEKKG